MKNLKDFWRITMKKLRIIVLCLLMFALLGAVVACGDDNGNGDQDAANEERTVALLTPYLSSVTTNQMVEYMTEGFSAHGVTVTTVDTQGDFAELASRIEDMTAAGVDAIVLVSVDPNQVATQIQNAFEAGIPVFGCDSGFIDGMVINATSDNRAMGDTITRYLFDDLMGGEGTVIALTHRPHPGVVMRSEAFDALLSEFSGISLITEQHVDVPNPIENARQIVENLLLANPEEGSVTAIWAAWDEPAIGATQALRDAGRTEIIVTGVDGNSQAVAMIEEGGNLKATLSQNFDGMAQLVVENVLAFWNGENVEPGVRYAPATLITQ